MARGVFTSQLRQRYLAIIDQLALEGPEGVIFGCTEIPILIKPEQCSLPVYDTTVIHEKAAVDFALKDEKINVQ